MEAEISFFFLRAIVDLVDLLVYKFIYLLMYFWLHWVFIAVHGLSLVVASGGYSFLWSTGSRHTGFSSCSVRAQ